MVISGNNLTTTNNTIISNEALQTYGFKNRIINGAMMIDQRNNGASISSISSGNTYFTDRFAVYSGPGGVLKGGQNLNSITPPNGFAKYFGVQTISANTSGINVFQQTIEGNNFYDFGFGTSNAKTITISFWVYSSLSGTFGGTFMNANQTRIYPFQWSYTTPNVWKYVTITIAGDPLGTWVGASNSASASLIFCLGGDSSYFTGTPNAWITSAGGGTYGTSGQVNIAGTVGATFYVTGVQLEQGSVATPFEQRPYGLELSLCQRYYEVIAQDNTINYIGVWWNSNGGVFESTMYFKTTKRVTPSLSVIGTPQWSVDEGTYYNTSNSGYTSSITINSFNLRAGNASTMPQRGGTIKLNGYVAASAEL